VRQLIVVLFFLTTASQAQSNCKSWFQKQKIELGISCLEKCVIAPIDMGTFECHEECDSLCDRPKSEKFVFQISDLYPGLTPSERSLIAQHPSELLEAYKLSWRAEGECLKEFPKSDRNDGSDACRHFFWATLLTQKMSHEMAQKILDAHEQEPSQPPEEKAMDLANNQRGVTFARAQKSNVAEEAIMIEFRNLMKDGKLVTLEKSK
jgi:hypothetical protein